MPTAPANHSKRYRKIQLGRSVDNNLLSLGEMAFPATLCPPYLTNSDREADRSTRAIRRPRSQHHFRGHYPAGSTHAPIERGRSHSLRTVRYGQPRSNFRNAELARRNPTARRFHLCRTGLLRNANNHASRENESGASGGILLPFVVRQANSGRFRSFLLTRDEFPDCVRPAPYHFAGHYSAPRGWGLRPNRNHTADSLDFF